MIKNIILNEDDGNSDIEKQKFSQPVTNNELYFYSEVNNESCFTLNKHITDLSKQLRTLQITFDLPSSPTIKLYINSDGGDIFGALSTVDRIKSSKVPVHSYVEGMAASAATLISVSCHKRYINKNAIMLVHQLRSWFGGTYENFKDESQNLDVITNLVKKIYLQNTKFTEKDLDEILKRDIYLCAEDAIKYGLADEIV